jgi:8-oxo-dGTP pyrophosphatase MutT (NUDIX family)
MAPTLDDIRRVLRGREPVCLPTEGRRVSAVLVPLASRGGDLHLVLTKRTETVATHRGQVSFPGGVAEPGDADLRHTALREAREELGLASEDVEILGRLDDCHTMTSLYHVAPFVGALRRTPRRWRADQREVAAVIEVPLSHLLDPKNTATHERDIGDGTRISSPAFQFGDHLIWGVTARILRDFLRLIAEREPDGADRP